MTVFLFTDDVFPCVWLLETSPSKAMFHRPCCDLVCVFLQGWWSLSLHRAGGQSPLNAATWAFSWKPEMPFTEAPVLISLFFRNWVESDRKSLLLLPGLPGFSLQLFLFLILCLGNWGLESQLVTPPRAMEQPLHLNLRTDFKSCISACGTPAPWTPVESFSGSKYSVRTPHIPSLAKYVQKGEKQWIFCFLGGFFFVVFLVFVFKAPNPDR